MPAKVKDYKDFIKAHNNKNCPSITGKKKAELKALAESLGFKEDDVKTTERKTAPAKKEPAKKEPAKKAPAKKEPTIPKTKLERMAERAEKKLERMRAERKKQDMETPPSKNIKNPNVDEKELKELVVNVEKDLAIQRYKITPKPTQIRNPNPKVDVKKINDTELKNNLNIIIDNYIFDNDKKVNKILKPIFTVPKYIAGDAIKEANEKFKKLNPELGKDYKELFDTFKKYSTEMTNRKINTQPYIKKINDYRKKNIEYIRKTLEI